MKVPKWLKCYLDEQGVSDIEKAIASAESQTSGEIVPMIVRRSSTVGHVAPLCVGILVILYMALNGAFYRGQIMGDAPWLSVLDVVILILAGNLLSQLMWVQRLLTSKEDRHSQVNMRAELEFFEHGLHKTDGATGVLLFVSVMEHRAVVLADKSIAEKMPPDTWQQVVDLILGGIKKKNMGQGFSDALKKCGEILTPHFPIAPDDKNELRDHLIIED